MDSEGIARYWGYSTLDVIFLWYRVMNLCWFPLYLFANKKGLPKTWLYKNHKLVIWFGVPTLLCYSCFSMGVRTSLCEIRWRLKKQQTELVRSPSDRMFWCHPFRRGWDIRAEKDNWAVACDFQQCGILTIVGSHEPVQTLFKLRNSKWYSVSSLTIIEYSSD